MRARVQVYYRNLHRAFEYVGELEVEGQNTDEILERTFFAMQNIEIRRGSKVEPLEVLPLLVAYKLRTGTLPRSMSVGDIVVVNGTAYYCDDASWKRLGETRR